MENFFLNNKEIRPLCYKLVWIWSNSVNTALQLKHPLILYHLGETTVIISVFYTLSFSNPSS